MKKTSGSYVDEKKIQMNVSTISNTSNDGNINNNAQIQSANNNITKEVKVMYGNRELNLKWIFLIIIYILCLYLIKLYLINLFTC